MYKMYLISAEGYKNAGVRFLRVQKTGKIWASMKDVGSGLVVKNMSDLVLKEIRSVLETKNPTNEQMKKYKMTEREIFEKYANLTENDLSKKSNKKVYVKNDVMTIVIKQCRGERKRGKRKIDGFRKKLMIPDSEIPECPEFKVKSKIGNIFVYEKILEKHSVKIYKIDPYFYEHYGKKIQVDENGCEYILFTIDVYFTEYLSAVEIDEKGHTDRDLIFEEKRQKVLEKQLGCKFIRTNASKEGYNADYETNRVQAFISKIKHRELKKLEKESNKKMKELKDENKELKCKNKELKDRIKEIKDKIKKLTNQSVYVVKNILPNYKK